CPNGPDQMYRSAVPSGSDEARPSRTTSAPDGRAHSTVWSGPASARGGLVGAAELDDRLGPRRGRRREDKAAATVRGEPGGAPPPGLEADVDTAVRRRLVAHRDDHGVRSFARR